MSKYAIHSEYTAENVNTEKKTTKNEKYVTNISDPNTLDDFASYTALFTLSALTKEEITRPNLLNNPPHDIIVKSGGIGNADNSPNPLNADNQKTLSKNERARGAVEKSQRVLAQNRDLYIKNVYLDAVPALNSARRMTSVTKLTMEIIEPAGITLLERIRGAAINNGYLDHLDAPYLLTIDFKGFDEMGRVASDTKAKAMKRVIPMKMIDLQMDVNSAGTVYNMTAIPWPEFGLVNTYSNLRTSGDLYLSKNKNLKDAAIALERLLNKQNEDEEGLQAEKGKADRFRVVIDPRLGADQIIDSEVISQLGMMKQEESTESGEEGFGGTPPLKYMTVSSGMNVIKILEEFMKGTPAFSDKKFNEFKDKCKTTLGAAQLKGGPQAVYEKAKEFYFDYFQVKAQVVPLPMFDEKRATNTKLVTYYVEPHKIHAYNLPIPGISSGDNFKAFVFKTYNYIFTGENINILDLSINYRLAYFQARLKDFEATNERANKIASQKVKDTGTTTAKDLFCDGNLLLKSEPGQAKSEGTGKSGATSTQLDSFLDSLTNPLADMVNIQMEILGDPAWISQSQFIPMGTEGLFPEAGSFQDKEIDAWRGNANAIWNTKLRCYNTDVAMPIIMLNFRMPTDLNDQTGVYELQSDQSAEFSGLYRVIRVEHNFVDGQYRNTLHLTRFNNQGACISDPVPKVAVLDRTGGMTEIVTATEAMRIIDFNNPFSKKLADLTSIKRNFENLVSSGISRVKNKITNKIKGLLS